MPVRYLRRGMTDGSDTSFQEAYHSPSYIHSLAELEKSIYRLIDSFIYYGKAMHYRMKYTGLWNETELAKTRYYTMHCLKSILLLQKQILEKLETLYESGFHDESLLEPTPSNPLYDDSVMEAFRKILLHPEDWRRLRTIFRDINLYSNKKENIMKRRFPISAPTRPWINTAHISNSIH